MKIHQNKADFRKIFIEIEPQEIEIILNGLETRLSSIINKIEIYKELTPFAKMEKTIIESQIQQFERLQDYYFGGKK